jgi:HEAT repeat protein
MLHRARITSSLVRSLLLSSCTAFVGTGAFGTGAIGVGGFSSLSVTAVGVSVVGATLLTGCKDESQPDYWIDKLEDPAWKPRAIKRLEQFFEDAMTRANGDANSPQFKALVDSIIEPLTKIYATDYENLDEKTRETLIKLLASFRDKRAEPGLKRAFEEFAKRGRGGRDVKWATRAVADLELTSLSDTIFGAFDKLRAESEDGAIAYRDLADAMVRLKSKSWVGPLSSKLDADINKIDPQKKDTIADYKDQVYWQATAAKVLGEIGDTAAIEPLLKVLLDPAKADVHSTALMALVKIGKPTLEPAIKLLNGQDTKLVEFSAQRFKRATGAPQLPKDKPHVQTAAVVLGMLGRGEALQPLAAALNAAQEDGTKALLAREITKIVPATTASKETFKQAYEGISGDTLTQQTNAIMMLTEAAGTFFDPSMIGWLLERAEKVEASPDVKKGIQGVITLTAIKLMKPEQVGVVSGAVAKYGTQIEKDAFQRASAMLKACGEKAACYLTEMEKTSNQDVKSQFSAIKAGYMLAVFGNEQTRDEIVKRMSSFENAAVRFVAAQTIDRLSPKGSPETADQLNAIIQKNAKTADSDKIAGDEPLKQVMYRLRSRAN